MTSLAETTFAPSANGGILGRLKLSRQAKGLTLGLGAAAVWGLYLALSRQGISAGLTAVDIAAFRFIPAGLVTLPWLLRAGLQNLGGVGWLRGAVLALCAGPAFILFGVGGYNFAPLAHGAVLQPATVTIGSMLLAALVLGDKPNAARVLGAGVILSALAVIAGPGLLKGSALTPVGDAMFIAAGMLWAVFTVLSRRWGVSPIAGVAAVSTLSAAALAPIVLFGVGLDHYLALPASVLVTQSVVQGLLAGVASVLAYSTAVSLLGPSRAAIFPGLVPVSAILIGVPIAGEAPNGLQLLGLGLASTGLMISLGVIHPIAWIRRITSR